jgi:hypothetical protein
LADCFTLIELLVVIAVRELWLPRLASLSMVKERLGRIKCTSQLDQMLFKIMWIKREQAPYGSLDTPHPWPMEKGQTLPDILSLGSPGKS